MKLEKLILENFRSYKERIEIDLSDLSVFVGKNDRGKSSILEALDIFFNENKGVIKIGSDDLNSDSGQLDDNQIIIGAILSDLPATLVIDSTNETTLSSEYLLNREEKLEIIKKYNKGGREKVFINAFHPTNPDCSGLLLKKNSELKDMVPEGAECSDMSRNAMLRKCIWEFYSSNLVLQDVEIELSKVDARDSWEKIKKYMPIYALFQADRKNSEGDDEIQNPMKFAVKEILKNENLASSLSTIAAEVTTKLNDVADRTLDKLNEMNPQIASSLNPVIPSAENLKWADVFKNVTITSDNNIPINKRGSGVKRLVLLNFFRAEAERRRTESNVQDIIYAIEEPETSQHPEHQRMLVSALKELSTSNHTQVLLTTHSPHIVKLLNFDDLQIVKQDQPKISVVKPKELPYSSINEVNFLAFGESDTDYHNELYGYIESQGLLERYKEDRELRRYVRLDRNNSEMHSEIIMSEYIRHQIHHPENCFNERYTYDELQTSIVNMREFLEQNKSP